MVAIPNPKLAKPLGSPTGVKIYSIPFNPSSENPLNPFQNRYIPLNDSPQPIILTILFDLPSVRLFKVVGAVFSIANITPIKNPKIIPNPTIFTVALNPSRSISSEYSTNSPKLL